MNKYLKNLNRIEFVVTMACTGKCKHCSQGEHRSSENIDKHTLWHAVKIQRQLNSQTVRFGKYVFHFTITKNMLYFLENMVQLRKILKGAKICIRILKKNQPEYLFHIEIKRIIFRRIFIQILKLPIVSRENRI